MTTFYNSIASNARGAGACLAVSIALAACGDPPNAPIEIDAGAPPIDARALTPAKLVIDRLGASFGSVTVGERSPNTRFLVTNVGERASDLVSLSFAGAGAAQFTIRPTTSCGPSLVHDAACIVDVAFAPHEPGPQTASLTIATNFGIEHAALDGIGVPLGALTITATSNELADNPQFILRNTGGTPTGPIVLQPSGAAPGDIAIVDDICSGRSLAPDERCAFGVRLDAKSPGLKWATVEVGARPGGIVFGAVRGFAPAPASLVTAFGHRAFGTVAVGDTSSTTIVVTNAGDLPTAPLLPHLGGSPAFTLTGACLGDRLAPHASCSLVASFAPAALGESTATVVLEDLTVMLDGWPIGSTHRITPSTSTFQTERQHESRATTFTIANLDAAPTGALTLRIDGAGGDRFAVVDTCTHRSLATGETCTANVRYVPEYDRSAIARLVVSAPTGDLLVASLAGFTIDPYADFGPSYPDFGSVTLGESAEIIATLTNREPAPVPLTTPIGLFTGPDASRFSLVGSTCTSTLDPLSSCATVVRFTPASALRAQSTLLPVATFVGAGASATGVTATPTRFEFPPTTIGSSREQTFTVRNRNQIPSQVIISTLGDFTAAESACSLPGGGTCTVHVRFTPLDARDRAGTLVVGGIPYALTGTGRRALEIVGVDGNLGSVSRNALVPMNVHVTLRNNDDVPRVLTPHFYFDENDWQLAGSSCNNVIAAHAECILRVRFTPTGLGERDDYLLFVGVDLDVGLYLELTAIATP